MYKKAKLINIKSEKGSITLFVLISMLFFMITLMGIYTSVSLRITTQEKEIQKIEKQYTVTDDEVRRVYEKVSLTL